MRYRCDANVMCPFYKGHMDDHIICEGVNEDSSIHNVFNKKKDTDGYKSYFCVNNWEQCLISKILYSKY